MSDIVTYHLDGSIIGCVKSVYSWTNFSLVGIIIGFKAKGASIFFNGFQNPNKVQIGVGGWVTARQMFRFPNPLVVKKTVLS